MYIYFCLYLYFHQHKLLCESLAELLRQYLLVFVCINTLVKCEFWVKQTSSSKLRSFNKLEKVPLHCCRNAPNIESDICSFYKPNREAINHLSFSSTLVDIKRLRHSLCVRSCAEPENWLNGRSAATWGRWGELIHPQHYQPLNYLHIKSCHGLCLQENVTRVVFSKSFTFPFFLPCSQAISSFTIFFIL